MCTVSGVLIIKGENYRDIERRFAEIVARGTDRGRDSYGVIVLDSDGATRSIKATRTPSPSSIKGLFTPKTSLAIANNRAEPTTERVDHKSEEDIQPFESEHFIVTHNGLIANDREIEAKYNIPRRTRIDSAVIPGFLESRWKGGSIESLAEDIRELKGSYAMIIADKRRPDRVFLVQNFKPIYMAYDYELGAVFFSSLDDYLNYGPTDRANVRKLRPYTAVEVDRNLSLKQVDLLGQRERKKVLVVASGGLDSTVAATKLLKEGHEITLLHFNYRHKAEEKEREAIRRISRHLNVDFVEVDTDLFRIIGGSTLLKGEGEIVRGNEGEEGAEFAHEWVPARNLVFIAIAIAIAEAKGYDAVASGINLEEAGAYPDNEMEFVRLLNALSPYAVGPNKRVEVLMPVGNLVKHEIVKLGLQLGAPLHLTWSCYEGGEKHCGTCGPCYMRKKAFKINGVEDPVEYQEAKGVPTVS